MFDQAIQNNQLPPEPAAEQQANIAPIQNAGQNNIHLPRNNSFQEVFRNAMSTSQSRSAINAAEEQLYTQINQPMTLTPLGNVESLFPHS